MANQETAVANSYESTLSASLDAGGTTINVASTDGTPGVPFYLVIDPGEDASREVVLVDQGKTGSTLTLSSSASRGQDGTSDVDHSSSAVIGAYPIAALWRDINDRVDEHSHSGGSDGAQVDHGDLGGLGGDDHPQYLNESRHDAADHDALSIDHGSLSGLGDFTADHGTAHDSHDHDPPIAASSVGADSVTLTQKTVSSLDSFEQWGTEEVSFADPGRQVTVDAEVKGFAAYNEPSAARRISTVRVQISFDGGSSWDSGQTLNQEVRGDDLRRVTVSAHHLRTGTPSGEVQVRAQVEQDAVGTPGDISWNNGSIIARMVPS